MLMATMTKGNRSKLGGIICFLGIPAALTVYFISIYVCAGGRVSTRSSDPLASSDLAAAHFQQSVR